MKGSCWAENVEWLLIRGATSLKGCCCRVDGAILSLTHSGKITALNNSCTDTPLSLASADIVWYDSSRIDNMNFAMADDFHLFPLPVVQVYNNLYTVPRPGPRSSFRSSMDFSAIRPFYML